MGIAFQADGACPIDTRIFCGHEYTLNNGRFALTLEPGNAELKSRMRDVESQRAQVKPTIPDRLGIGEAHQSVPAAGLAEIRRTLGLEKASDVEVFAEMRKRKDSF